MAKKNDYSPLLVIVGETGSGKTALAISLAQRFGGEILCADSRTVYKGMDIGTAKPTSAEQAGIPHFGLNLTEPGKRFTVADFKDYAQATISAIAERGRLPIMVGGTGLYIDALLYDFQFRPLVRGELDAGTDTGDLLARRVELEALGVSELQRRLTEKGIAIPGDGRNPRHLVRALETGGAQAVRSPLRLNTLILGMQVDREVLRERIERRVRAMLDSGLLAEVQALSQQYGWDVAALQAPGYKELRGVLDGTKTMDAARAEIIQSHMSLAKRQRTWFKRNKSIHWLTTEDKLAEAVDSTTTFLNK